MDTGNNNFLPTSAKCNFPPYGKDFIDHQPTGRFSNGKVPSDFIASKFGIKEVLPAYLSTELRDEDLPTGVCFASGGAGYDHLTTELAAAISLQGQLELFADYKEKLQAITDQERAATIVRESLYVICIGSNDIVNNYFSPVAIRKKQYDYPSYVSFLMTKASSAIEDLYNLGARKIVVVGAPPLGCVPSQRTIYGGLQRDCVDQYNEASQSFNVALSRELGLLREKLSTKTIIYADIFEKLLALIQYPSNYGFGISTKGCCGTGKIEVTYLCNKFTSICDDDTNYVFWDSFHPTEKAYGILIDELIQQEISAFL